MKKIIHYELCDNAELQKLVEGDVSYTVLYKILGDECDHIFSDGEKFIICHSNPPYPVWVWRKDGDDMECTRDIAKCIKDNFPLDKFNITLPKDTLDHMAEFDEYFKRVNVKMNLFSYRLTKMKKVDYDCDGNAELATLRDLDTLAKIWQDMAFEMEGYEFDIEHCRESVLGQIEEERLFIWRNRQGKIVATTNYGVLGKFGKVAGVYTLPDYRRCGYAINLVTRVTEILLGKGLIPTLYTDGDYSASNDCYKKIGYEQVGQLTTIYK